MPKSPDAPPKKRGRPPKPKATVADLKSTGAVKSGTAVKSPKPKAAAQPLGEVIAVERTATHTTATVQLNNTRGRVAIGAEVQFGPAPVIPGSRLKGGTHAPGTRPPGCSRKGGAK